MAKVIICAELSEAKNIRCPDAKIYVSGVGLSNILQAPRLELKPSDKIINVGYVGSAIYPIGTVISVSQCLRLNKPKITCEKILTLKPCYADDVCYTADDFIEDKEIKMPLVDMELYYLASIYPQIQSIKIVSDNFDLEEHRQDDFKASWEIVNEVLNRL